MKIIIQKVNFAKIFVNEKFKGEIGTGIVAYVGISNEDTEKDINFCIDKLINLRIFNDENNKMNLSLKDVNGELLVVSNFTIYGNTKKEDVQVILIQHLQKKHTKFMIYY